MTYFSRHLVHGRASGGIFIGRFLSWIFPNPNTFIDRDFHSVLRSRSFGNAFPKGQTEIKKKILRIFGEFISSIFCILYDVRIAQYL